MSYVPATANPDMWVVIGGMVAGAFAVVWRSRSGNGHAAPAVTGVRGQPLTFYFGGTSLLYLCI